MPLALALLLAAADRPPNFVLIVADDLGYGDVGCFGAKDIRTPNLDRLAGEGTRFTNFCVAQAVCTASRAALLSGCYPNRIGLAGALNHTSRAGIHPDETLLPELLKAKGYAAACFGKWHLGTAREFFPTRNGFDVWQGLPYSNDNGPLHPTIRGIPPLPWLAGDRVAERDPNQAGFSARIAAAAAGFIADHRSKPFFLYLPHIMPHVPIFASERFRGKSQRGLYGDVVEELDDAVGATLRALAEHGLERDTVVAFLSDNGPFLSYGEHAGSAGPFRGGKLTAFEGGVRSPLLVRWPGRMPAGRVADGLVAGMDLLPTLAAFAGAKLPERRIDGLDLSPLWLGTPDAKGRETLAYYSGAELHAVRRGDLKLHFPHDYLEVDGEPGRGGKPSGFARMRPKAITESGIRGIASRHGYRVERLGAALYDLAADPAEAKNLAAERPADVAALTALAAGFRRDLGDALTGVQGAGLRAAGHAAAPPNFD